MAKKSKRNLQTIIAKKPSKEKNHIGWVLKILKSEGTLIEYVEELKFHPIRRWRFDWAIESEKVAIEYEGIYSKKSRHTTLTGYSKDCEKYNEAAKLGWRVLRYTSKNYTNIEKDLKGILI